MLCGLLKPTGGEAHVVGLDLRHATGAAKGQLGYMAQKFSLYGLLSVRQNLEFSAGVYGLDGAARRARIDEMIDIFGLQPWLSAAPDSLPLGVKQRLALACAVMHRPPVLFLDEPTRSEEHTSELQSLMRISYAVFCLKQKKKKKNKTKKHQT